MSGAPLAQVHQGADTALFQKTIVGCRLRECAGSEIEPCLGKGSPAQVKEAVAMPERGAGMEEAVIADGEAVVSRAALEEAIDQAP